MKKLSADTVISRIDDLKGNVSAVATTLQVSRTTLYKFIAKHPKVKTALDEAREKMIDNVESALYSKALNGDTVAMIFFLKTQGKRRGYIEGIEHTGPNGGPIELSWKQFVDQARKDTPG